MTTILRVHFDGKVLVPDEPVDLPVGQVLEVRIAEAAAADGAAPLHKLAELARKFPSRQGVPTDRAAQHDHYLYGAAKRS